MAISMLYEEDKQKVAMSPMNRSVESGRYIKENNRRDSSVYVLLIIVAERNTTVPVSSSIL